MKKYFLFLSVVPFLATAQVTKSKAKAAAKVQPASANVTALTPDMVSQINGGFSISGNIAGMPDGTTLKMLNANTGAEEQNVNVQKGKFTFTGKVAAPDFKVIGVNGQPPFITVFIDNSKTTLTGTNVDFQNAVLKGSSSNDGFASFIKETKPYEDMLLGKGRFDVDFMDKGAMAIENFISTHKNDFITPLAIFRYSQLTGDNFKPEQMYNTLSAPVKASPLGNALVLQIIEPNKALEFGKPVADFTQPDTAGNNISLSSFKGKYVLIDFWASWCGPCRAENPNVVNSFEKYKNKNFTILSVSLDRAKQNWVDAIAADNLKWTHVSDLQFWNNSAAKQFGISSIPQNLLIDPQGNLIGKNLRGAALEYRLSKILAN